MDQSASCLGGVVDTSEPRGADGLGTARTCRYDRRAINGVGIAGVAAGVKVASVKVVNDDGFIYPEAADLRVPLGSRPGCRSRTTATSSTRGSSTAADVVTARPPGRAARCATPRRGHRRWPRREQQCRPAAQVHRRGQPERRQLARSRSARSTPAPRLPAEAPGVVRCRRRTRRAVVYSSSPGRRRRRGPRRRHSRRTRRSSTIADAVLSTVARRLVATRSAPRWPGRTAGVAALRFGAPVFDAAPSRPCERTAESLRAPRACTIRVRACRVRGDVHRRRAQRVLRRRQRQRVQRRAVDRVSR